MAGESLFRKTSKLPATELVPPRHVIGKRTEECIRSGVVLGAAEAIDGLVRRIKKAWPRSGRRPARAPLVIATGGLAQQFESLCRTIDVVDPNLTLKGLAIAYSLLHGGGRRSE
jgi:type III pantothenate kinase